MNFQEQWRKLLLPLRYGGSGVDFKSWTRPAALF